MHIQSLRLRNFRGFEDATLDLDRPLTVLFGVNGSGKSSVLMALALVFTDILMPTFDGIGVGFSHWIDSEDLRFGSDSLVLNVEFSTGSSPSTYQLQYKRSEKPQTSSGAWHAHPPTPPSEILFLPIYYQAERHIKHSTQLFAPLDPAKTEPADAYRHVYADTLGPGYYGFRTLFNWFKEREDAENRLKVNTKDLSVSDPQLSAVRRAIQKLLPGFSEPRIQYDPLRLEIRKGDQALSINQLSDGEKMIFGMTADIARRLAMAYPQAPDPLQQEAIVLIDEVELHLHPAWQRRVLPAWTRAFPNTQFIATTHSPQVISEVPNDAVICIENFLFVRPGAPTEGRDSNSILEEAMGAPERPENIKQSLAEIGRLIDEEHYPDAKKQLDALAQKISENDHEIVRLRTLLHFMEAGDAPDPQER